MFIIKDLAKNYKKKEETAACIMDQQCGNVNLYQIESSNFHIEVCSS
jgi:hypothetical protein